MRLRPQAVCRKQWWRKPLTSGISTTFARADDSAGRGIGLSWSRDRSGSNDLDDSVWLATNDNYGTLADVPRDIAAFFERYAEFEALIPTAA
jgi:hypothetical protein